MITFYILHILAIIVDLIVTIGSIYFRKILKDVNFLFFILGLFLTLFSIAKIYDAIYHPEIYQQETFIRGIDAE